MAFARDVTERKAMLAQLMAADKLAAVGTLAAGVAHEINNPLAYLLLNLEFLIRELPRRATTARSSNRCCAGCARPSRAPSA